MNDKTLRIDSGQSAKTAEHEITLQNGERDSVIDENDTEDANNTEEISLPTAIDKKGSEQSFNKVDLKPISKTDGNNTSDITDRFLCDSLKMNKDDGTYPNDDFMHKNEENGNRGVNETNDTGSLYVVTGINEVDIPLLKDSDKTQLQYSVVNDEDGYELKERLVNKQNEMTLYESEKPLTKTRHCLQDPPDGGWGWVVTFSAFMVGLILDGVSFSFGIYFKELYVYFNESKGLTSWIISVLNGTYLSIGPVSSVMVSIFGCRKVAIFGAILSSVAFFLCTWSPNVQVMILLYGLVGGAGLGQMYLPTIVTVGHYFKKKRALATGIAVCGSGIGGFVFAPLSQFLIDKYTWKGAMWVISAITLNGVVVAGLLRPIASQPRYKRNQSFTDKSEQSRKTVSERRQCCDMSEIFDFSLLKSLTFLVYGCSCFLCMLGFFIPFTFVPDLSEDKGMTSQQGALLISIIGILNTVARVGVGWIADRSWADALMINSVAVVVGGATTMFVPYYESFGLLATYCVIFGVAAAVFAALRPVILADLLGVEKLTSSFGLVTLCQGLASFIGAPIAGAVSDITGNYKGAFFLAGATMCLSGIICFPLRKLSQWENRRASKDEDDADLNDSI